MLLHKLMGTICFSLVFLANSSAQSVPATPYNLNTNTYLPSNHVYGSTVDHLGYLWLATPKGIVRYNGYEARLFSVNNGLPVDDIWYLMEDKAGRMWFCSMSYELGFIQNNRYHVVLKNAKDLIAPKSMVRYQDGIAAIICEYKLSKDNYEQKLILFTTDSGLKIIDIPGNDDLFLSIDQKSITCFEDSSFAQGKITDNGILWTAKKRLAEKELSKLGPYIISRQLFNNKLYHIGRHNDGFGLLDMLTGKAEIIPCSFRQSDEKTVYGYIRDSLYIVSSTKGIYLYDSSSRLVAHYALASLTGNEKTYDEQPCIFNDYPLWGLTLGTSNRGAYVRNKDSTAFIPAKELELYGYSFIGSPGIDHGVWWHPGKHEMKVLYEDAKVVDIKVPYLDQVTGISACINGNVLVSGDASYIWLPWGNTGLQLFPKDKNRWFHSSHLITPPVALSKDSIFMIESGGKYTFSGRFKGQYKKLSDVHFNKMTLDRSRYGIWLYRNQMAAFYNIKNNTFRFFYPDTLRKTGLRRIEEIAVDEKYGNIFVKDYDGIYLIDEHFSRVRPLFPGICCNNARMLVQNGKLLVAGRFGLLYCKITDKHKIEEEKWYENYKDIYYQQIYGLQLLGTWAILNTDKGTYRVSLNSRSKSLSGENDPGYRFIVYANNTPTRINAYDTVLLQPGTLSMEWDVIRPKGTGKPETYLKDDMGAWRILSSKEINISGFPPGKWHKLYLKAKDDIWQSEVLPVYVYLQPHWWQTTSFLLLILCGSVLLTLLIILITRRVVIHKQEQKRQEVEMGLAGIYAQINPHFMFNSLNIAQFFIKANQMQEAHSHINRFSKLLRSFLHASKHRYITIEEEVANLKNYIELQQTRFTEPFDYTVSLSPKINTNLKIPSLLLQPLVENAIQHGLFNRKEKGGILLLSFEQEKKQLVITIEDNGIGRKLAKEKQSEIEKRESYGNDLIQKLIFVFNKYEKINISLSYLDKTGVETGTIVKIVITYPFI